MVEKFPDTPAVGGKVTAAWGADVAKDAVIADTGTVVVTPVANTPTATTIAFNKTFPSTPKVVVSFLGPASTMNHAYYANVTTTGADIGVLRTNTTNTTVTWLAILTH